MQFETDNNVAAMDGGGRHAHTGTATQRRRRHGKTQTQTQGQTQGHGRCHWLQHKKNNVSFSFIIHARNDIYSSDPTFSDSIHRLFRLFQRLTLFSNWVSYDMQHSVEIIILEWNSDPLYPHILEVEEFQSIKDEILVPVRWLNVNYSVHEQICLSKFGNIQARYTNYTGEYSRQCNIIEWIAKNMAAWRSCGNVLIFMTSDSFPSLRLLSYLAHCADDEHFESCPLFLDRDMLISFNRRDIYITAENEHALSNAEAEAEYARANLTRAKYAQWQCPAFETYRLDWAAGEFSLLFKETFDRIGGYCEAPQVTGMDGEFILRAQHGHKLNVVSLPWEDCQCWHQFHGRNKKELNVNMFLSPVAGCNAAKGQATIHLDQIFDRRLYMCGQMEGSWTLEYVLYDSWGVRDIHLPEILWLPKRH